MKNYLIVDLSFDKSNINSYISNTLLINIEKDLKNSKKIILYINKRGEYNLLICKDCNYIKKCPKCDIVLSVHKNPEKLICHHCSYNEDIYLDCEKCGSVNLNKIGVGTQQIENSLKKYFKDIKIFRMDSDNVKNNTLKKEALKNIINSQIVIGTKMITTGFDFKNIGTIGVILLEQELQVPKYDTEEKIYSNIKQLIGRGGRQGEETNIIIQTFIPKNEMIKSIVELNYKNFFKKILLERKIFNYPPYIELAVLRYKNINKLKSIEFINILKTKLDSLNNGNYEIIKVENVIKRDNQYFSKIIIKGQDIRFFLKNIKFEIFSNKDLSLIFE